MEATLSQGGSKEDIISHKQSLDNTEIIINKKRQFQEPQTIVDEVIICAEVEVSKVNIEVNSMMTEKYINTIPFLNHHCIQLHIPIISYGQNNLLQSRLKVSSVMIY